MENKMVFGKWEAITLLMNMISTKIVLNFQRKVAEDAGTAGWILTIYISILALLGFMVIEKLYTEFEGKDLLDIGEYIGGTVGRVMIGSIIFIFLVYIVTVVLREFSENLKIVTLTVSPISFVSLFFLAGMIVGAYLGLEALVRLHAIAIPVLTVTFLFISFAISQYFDISRIMPIFGTGLRNIFVSGFTKVSIFAELLILFLIVPYIRTHKNFKTVGYTSLFIAGFSLTMSSLIFLLVFPYPAAIEGFLPMYQLSRLINYGRFFQRVESVFVFTWGIVALLYLSAGFYFIVFTFKKTFNLTYYQPLIIPFAILIYTMSFLPPNLDSTVILETKYFRNTAWLVTFVMPIVILLIAKTIKKRKKEVKHPNG